MVRPRKRILRVFKTNPQDRFAVDEDIRDFPATEREFRTIKALPDKFTYIVSDVARSTRSLYSRYLSITERPQFFDERFESQKELWRAPSVEAALNLRTNYLDVLAIQIWFAWNKAMLSDRQESMNYLVGYQDDLATLALYFAVPAIQHRFKTYNLGSKSISVMDLLDKVQSWIAHKTGEKVVTEDYLGRTKTTFMGKNAFDAYSPYKRRKQAGVVSDDSEDDDEEVVEQEERINHLGIKENSFKAHISRYVKNAARTISTMHSRSSGVATIKDPNRKGMQSIDSTIGDESGDDMLFSETLVGRENYLIQYKERGMAFVDDILKTLIKIIDPTELYTTRPDTGISLRDWLYYRLWYAHRFEGGYTAREVGLLYQWGTRPWIPIEIRENKALIGTRRNEKFFTTENHAIKLLTGDFWKVDVCYTCSKCGQQIPMDIPHCRGAVMEKTEITLTYAHKFRTIARKGFSESILKDTLSRVRIRLLRQIFADGLIEKPKLREIQKHKALFRGLKQEAEERVKAQPSPIRHISIDEYLQDPTRLYGKK